MYDFKKLKIKKKMKKEKFSSYLTLFSHRVSEAVQKLMGFQLEV